MAGLDEGVDAALELVGLVITVAVKSKLRSPERSRPGEPPGIVTGGLFLSYKWEVGVQAGVRYVAVGSDESTLQPGTGRPVDYAAFLEFGTSRMEPRPHLRPAVNEVRARLPHHITERIEAAQREQARRERGR